MAKMDLDEIAKITYLLYNIFSFKILLSIDTDIVNTKVAL